MRLDLRPHQSEALAAVNTALAHSPRATVVMACGSGKTLLGLRVAADADRVLLLEPSLALIRQSLEHAPA